MCLNVNSMNVYLYLNILLYACVCMCDLLCFVCENSSIFLSRLRACSKRYSDKEAHISLCCCRSWYLDAGNEGDVTVYVNHTGLMWENAPQFGALLVFAEHRYYGLSQPFGDAALKHIQYLTHEQV